MIPVLVRRRAARRTATARSRRMPKPRLGAAPPNTCAGARGRASASVVPPCRGSERTAFSRLCVRLCCALGPRRAATFAAPRGRGAAAAAARLGRGVASASSPRRRLHCASGPRLGASGPRRHLRLGAAGSQYGARPEPGPEEAARGGGGRIWPPTAGGDAEESATRGGAATRRRGEGATGRRRRGCAEEREGGRRAPRRRRRGRPEQAEARRRRRDPSAGKRRDPGDAWAGRTRDPAACSGIRQRRSRRRRRPSAGSGGQGPVGKGGGGGHGGELQGAPSPLSGDREQGGRGRVEERMRRTGGAVGGEERAGDCSFSSVLAYVSSNRQKRTKSPKIKIFIDISTKATRAQHPLPLTGLDRPLSASTDSIARPRPRAEWGYFGRLPWKQVAAAMQEALISPAANNAGRLRSAFELSPFAFGDQRLASPRYLNLVSSCGGGDDALFRCSSPFSPSFGFSSPSPLATSSVSLSPSSSASLVDECDDATAHRLQLARLELQYQDVADRYELCLARLAEAADEAAALRRENAELRVANGDLTRRLALLSGIGKQAAAAAIADEVRRLRFGDQNKKPVVAAAPPPPEKLAVLPKSISVRSKEYLKMNQQAAATATPAAANNRKPKASNPTNLSSQRAYVADGGKKGEEPKDQQHAHTAGGMELEVYNQGMSKTELCNKWEETGACPYGDQCQFAHGIAELRPVIRHPRYKTQVCRMVLAGEVCPYGHRCHFRHTLTPAERLHPLPQP